MKTEWIDNKPKYKAGDLVLYYSESGSFNDTGVAGIVKSVAVMPHTKKSKEIIEKNNSERRNCCGGNSRKSGLNQIIYTLEDGKEVHGNMILYSGVTEINNLLRHLREEVKRKKEKLHDVGLAMGLDEWDIPN